MLPRSFILIQNKPRVQEPFGVDPADCHLRHPLTKPSFPAGFRFPGFPGFEGFRRDFRFLLFRRALASASVNTALKIQEKKEKKKKRN